MAGYNIIIIRTVRYSTAAIEGTCISPKITHEPCSRASFSLLALVDATPADLPACYGHIELRISVTWVGDRRKRGPSRVD